ncbi:MAG TPA: lytic murein transglycosylase [Caulobacteraceae bacterium]
MHRRLFLSLAIAGCAGAASAQAPTPADLLGASGEPYFIDWLNGFYAKAIAAGIPRPVADRELSGLTPDPRIGALDARQPEFARPVGDYIKGVVTDNRIAAGRIKRRSVPGLNGIERTYGVPRDILIGVWAMESGFGALQGDFDTVRSLGTLAALGRRRPWAEAELIAALRILALGDVPRARLRGSWAGAMGQTQLLPSTYLSSAVDGDGDGRRDIWGSAPDALASAANLLAKGGWRTGEGWASEVILPANFDYGLSEGPRQPPAWWRAHGARRADGGSWSMADAAASASLILPAGASGPAFLVFPNHFAIRTYNNSIAYALAVGLLADGFAGDGALRTPWPHETALSLTDRMAAQTALVRLGYNPGQPDGVVGLSTRAALRAWQKSRGLPADGYLSPQMVSALRGAAGPLGPT